MSNNNNELDYYLKLLVRSSAFVFIAVIISKLASYGYKIAIAKYFGSETYGLFSLAIIVIGIITSVASLGLGEGIIRYVSYYRGKKRFESIKILIDKTRNVFLFTAVLSTIALILTAPFISDKIFRSEEFTPLIIGMAFAIPFILLSNIYLAVLRGFEKIKTYSALINIYQNSARLILILLFLMMGFGILSISLSYVITFSGLLLLSWYYSKKDLNTLEVKESSKDKRILKQAMSYSWPLLFTSVLYNAFYWTDSLLLGYFDSVEIVGLYSAAITITSLFGIAPDLFMQMFFPLISFKYSQGKKELIAQLTRQVVKWIYILNIAVFLLVFFFPNHILNILFGPDFIGAAGTLRLLSIGALFSGTMGLATNLLSIKGKTKTVLVDFIVFATINLFLNIILIPKYGMVGAALTTILTQAAFLITAFYQIKRAYKFNIIKSGVVRLFVVSFAGLVIGFLLLFDKEIALFQSLLVGSIIILIYLFLIYSFKIFDKEDLEIIKSIVKKAKIKR